MRCFPEYKRWAPLWLAPHSTDRPLHESLALRHCPGHSCIERAVAVHCSQLDNQPKKYKECFKNRTRGCESGGRKGGGAVASPREVRNSNWIKQALKLLFHLSLCFFVVPVAAWAKGASFFSCFLQAAPWDEQDPHTAVTAGKKAS